MSHAVGTADDVMDNRDDPWMDSPGVVSCTLVLNRSRTTRAQHPCYLEPCVLTRVGALGHVLPTVLDRSLVKLRMIVCVATRQLHQLGEDFTAHLGTVVGYGSTVDHSRTGVPDARVR